MKSGLEKLFPRDVYGRVALFIASTVLAGFGGVACYALVFTAPAPADIGMFIVRGAIVELLVSWTIFFTCGFIWALATPSWLEDVLELATKKFLFALMITLVPFFAFAIWIILK